MIKTGSLSPSETRYLNLREISSKEIKTKFVKALKTCFQVLVIVMKMFTHWLTALYRNLRLVSGLTNHRSRSGSKPFDTLILFLKEFYDKVILEKTPKAPKLTQHAKIQANPDWVLKCMRESFQDYS